MNVPRTAAILFTSLAIAAAAPALAAIGLGTQFATVTLEKLSPGGMYNLTQLRSLPLKVINTGDVPVEAAVDIEPPAPDELKEGYEAIPDPAWVRIIPTRFTLQPGETARCDVVISLPDDSSLVGRHFQLKIWSHTAGDGAFGAGVVNRMFFSVGVPGPESLQRAKRAAAVYVTDVNVEPDTLYLTVPRGGSVSLKRLRKQPTIVNKGSSDITLRIVEDAGGSRIPVPEGYVPADGNVRVTVQPKNIRVKRRSLRDIDATVAVDSDERLRGARLAHTLLLTPVKPEFPLEFTVRLLITVSEPGEERAR